MTIEPNFISNSRVIRTSVVVTVLMCLAGFYLYSYRGALSVAFGGLLSIINFHWLKQAVDFIILQGGQGRVGRRIVLQYAGRYALIGAALYVTMRVSVLEPAPFLAGLLVYVIAILLAATIEIGKSLIRDYRNGRTPASDR